MNVLITGIGGLIGGRFAKWLLDNVPDVHVTGIDDFSCGYPENVDCRVELIRLSLGTGDMRLRLPFRRGVDYVLHCAAYAAEGLSPWIRRYNYTNNLLATAEIINECIESGTVKRLVFTSSMATYGRGTPPFDEADRPAPIDPYGVAKWACEQDIAIAGEQHGLDYCVIRPHNCYDDKTEVLTENGFKFFADLDGTERVATLQQLTGELQYHKPTAYQKFEHNGEMLRFCNRSYDMCVTPDHRMWVSYVYPNRTDKNDWPWVFVPSSQLVASETAYAMRLRRNIGSWNGEDVPTVHIPACVDSAGRPMNNAHQNGGAKTIPMELWCEFLGWYLSEGSRFKTKANYVISISQYATCNQANRDRICELVREMGYAPYAKSPKEIRVFSKQLYDALDAWGIGIGTDNKRIPLEIKRLATKYLRPLYDSLMKGDGNAHGKRFNAKCSCFIDDFAEIAMKLGYSVTTAWDDHLFRASITEDSFPQIGDNGTKRVNYETVQYSGFVYDLTVENHVIFVRRNGKGCWSSNCYGPGQSIWQKYRNVLGIWMARHLDGLPLLVYGDGTQRRAFSYIDDCLPCLWKAATSPACSRQTINLGGIHPTTILNAAETLVDVMGGGTIEHRQPRHEVSQAWSTHAKSVELLDYADRTPLRDGLASMWDWAKDAWPRYPERRTQSDNIKMECRRGIYEFWT